jgi:response regulator of citrate/malate metabolism
LGGLETEVWMGKILIIDDDETFTRILSDYISTCYPLLQVETCSNPLQASAMIRKRHPDLLLVDLEMPTLDGNKILRFATDMGINKNRIVILSGRDADYLHERFPLGACLAVLNKFEARQKAVLDMIFSSLQKKTAV